MPLKLSPKCCCGFTIPARTIWHDNIPIERTCYKIDIISYPNKVYAQKFTTQGLKFVDVTTSHDLQTGLARISFGDAYIENPDDYGPFLDLGFGSTIEKFYYGTSLWGNFFKLEYQTPFGPWNPQDYLNLFPVINTYFVVFDRIDNDGSIIYSLLDNNINSNIFVEMSLQRETFEAIGQNENNTHLHSAKINYIRWLTNLNPPSEINYKYAAGGDCVHSAHLYDVQGQYLFKQKRFKFIKEIEALPGKPGQLIVDTTKSQNYHQGVKTGIVIKAGSYSDIIRDNLSNKFTQDVPVKYYVYNDQPENRTIKNPIDLKQLATDNRLAYMDIFHCPSFAAPSGSVVNVQCDCYPVANPSLKNSLLRQKSYTLSSEVEFIIDYSDSRLTFNFTDDVTLPFVTTYNAGTGVSLLNKILNDNKASGKPLRITNPDNVPVVYTHTTILPFAGQANLWEYQDTSFVNSTPNQFGGFNPIYTGTPKNIVAIWDENNVYTDQLVYISGKQAYMQWKLNDVPVYPPSSLFDITLGGNPFGFGGYSFLSKLPYDVFSVEANQLVYPVFNSGFLNALTDASIFGAKICPSGNPPVINYCDRNGDFIYSNDDLIWLSEYNQGTRDQYSYNRFTSNDRSFFNLNNLLGLLLEPPGIDLYKFSGAYHPFQSNFGTYNVTTFVNPQLTITATGGGFLPNYNYIYSYAANGQFNVTNGNDNRDILNPYLKKGIFDNSQDKIVDSPTFGFPPQHQIIKNIRVYPDETTNFSGYNLNTNVFACNFFPWHTSIACTDNDAGCLSIDGFSSKQRNNICNSTFSISTGDCIIPPSTISPIIQKDFTFPAEEPTGCDPNRLFINFLLYKCDEIIDTNSRWDFGFLPDLYLGYYGPTQANAFFQSYKDVYQNVFTGRRVWKNIIGYNLTYHVYEYSGPSSGFIQDTGQNLCYNKKRTLLFPCLKDRTTFTYGVEDTLYDYYATNSTYAPSYFVGPTNINNVLPNNCCFASGNFEIFPCNLLPSIFCSDVVEPFVNRDFDIEYSFYPVVETNEAVSQFINLQYANQILPFVFKVNTQENDKDADLYLFGPHKSSYIQQGIS